MGRGWGVGEGLMTGVQRDGGKGVGGGVNVGQVSDGAVGSTSVVGGGGVCSGETCDSDTAVVTGESCAPPGSSIMAQPASPISRAMATNADTLVNMRWFFILTSGDEGDAPSRDASTSQKKIAFNELSGGMYQLV